MTAVINKRKLKNELLTHLKTLIEESLSSQIEIRMSGNEVFFHLGDENQELLGLRFLTDTHIPMGAILAITFQVKVTNGPIYRVLHSLVAKDNILPSIYTEFSSNLSKYAPFRNHGVVAFYPNDNVETFVKTFYPILLKEFIFPAFFLLKGGAEVIDNVVAKPKSYSYPLATILVSLSTQGKLEDYESILSLYTGFSPQDRKFVFTNDLIEKLKQLEDTCIKFEECAF